MWGKKKLELIYFDILNCQCDQQVYDIEKMTGGCEPLKLNKSKLDKEH